MNSLHSIIYYSSNREKPEFEHKVIMNLVKNCGKIPIISVTQKPMPLGKNICVGDVGVSNFNMFRQMQIACKAATTKFVIHAEADCLYPPDYFTFTPPDDRCYRNNNLYVMGQGRDFFWEKKEGASHAQIVNRKTLLYRIEELFKGLPEWNTEEKNFPKERTKKDDIWDDIQYWTSDNPVVQIKTGNAMRHYTHSERIDIYELPYWGDGKILRGKMICD